MAIITLVCCKQMMEGISWGTSNGSFGPDTYVYLTKTDGAGVADVMMERP